MPIQFLDHHRRTALLLFYSSALLCTVSVGLAGKVPSLRRSVLTLAIAFAGISVLFLLRFLRSNDERERQINYRALSFAFVSTLAFSLTIGFLQRFGFHPVSWLGIPALMLILWSLGLVLYSWRYR